jgi:ATP-binding protein involved in chromosome partitioning
MASLLTPDRGALLRALDAVTDPATGLGLQAAGRVAKLELGFGRAAVRLEVPPEADARYAALPGAVEAALRAVAGVRRVHVVMAPVSKPPQASVPLGEDGPTVRVRKGARLSSEAQDQSRFARGAAQPVAHVRHVVAVASGKGGVGKSTVAVNLACALAALGLRVGVADADVYGPSLPRMLGLDADPEIGPDKKLIPVPAWGVTAMSIGFMVDEGAPMIWRGPMASSAVNQILHETAWGSEAEPLDVLLVDLPPGTGDVQLTLVQKVELAGAVIVSTPQEIALIDARRAAAMFGKTGVPILGVIENMAYLPHPAGGAPIEIFGRGGARREAETLSVPFLGEIPIDAALRAGADAGRPLTAAEPESSTAQAFAAIARDLAGRLP